MDVDMDICVEEWSEYNVFDRFGRWLGYTILSFCDLGSASKLHHSSISLSTSFL
jgi:hypothetical protein